MAAAAQQDTVWVGFLDIVPVIGTVKEAVEWVMALYEGNKKLADEKEKAFRELLFTPQPCRPPKKERRGLATFWETVRRADRDAASASAVQDVTEIKLEELIEYVRSVSHKRKKTESKPPKKDDSERVRKIEATMIQNIELIKPDYHLKKALEKEICRSKRGEHVFNTAIVKFHNEFLTKFLPNHLQLQGQTRSEYMSLITVEGSATPTEDIKATPTEDIKATPTEDIKATPTEDIKADIEKNMVVYFDEEDFYVNANAIIFGVYCQELRLALAHVVSRQTSGRYNDQSVKNIIHFMNKLEIYVDHFAKVKWINNDNNKRRRVEVVRTAVESLYNEHGLDWCTLVQNKISNMLPPVST